MLNEEDIHTEITGNAEAIIAILDDMSVDMPMRDQHRLHAILKLAEDQIRLAVELTQMNMTT